MKETLAFQIVYLYREFLAYTVKELKTMDLTFGQIPFIIYAGKHPGCVQADLTKKMHLDWGYCQRGITRLVDSGFMTKTYDEERNGNCLDLTEKGRQAFELSHRVFHEWDRMKLNNFSEEEKNMLIELLKKLTA